MIEITKHGDRSFAVREDGELLTVCVYRKGAVAVKDRLEMLQASIRALETKCAAMREPLLWEEYWDSAQTNRAGGAAELPSRDGVGRASEDDRARLSTDPVAGASTTGTKGE